MSSVTFCIKHHSSARSGGDGGLHGACALGLEHVDKLLKAHVRVVGARGRLGMVLDAHGLLGLAQQPRACAVVEIDVSHLHVVRKCGRVDCVVVVLCADLYPACAAVRWQISQQAIMSLVSHNR